MDALVAAYIQTTYTRELVDDMVQTLTLMEQHQHPDPYFNIVEVLGKDLGAAIMSDLVSAEFHNMIDHLLSKYTIVTRAETSLHMKNQILIAINIASDLENPSPVLTKFESFCSDEEKLAWMISQFSSLDITDVMTAIAEFDPTLIAATKQLLYLQEEALEPGAPAKKDIIHRMQVFTKAFPASNLGVMMIKSGVEVGMPFESYIPLIEEAFIGQDVETSALNVLSVILMSEDGLEQTIQIYRKYSMQIFSDVQAATEVEKHLSQLIGQFNEQMTFTHEKARLSSPRHTG